MGERGCVIVVQHGEERWKMFELFAFLYIQFKITIQRAAVVYMKIIT